jgi:hypothetical protein
LLIPQDEIQTTCQDFQIMSVSGIPSSAPLPYNYLDTNPPAQAAPAPTADNDSSDATTAQPQAQPPLPPGQGTRVNQLV